MPSQLKRLLFVDDGRNVLEALQRMLRQSGESWDASYCQTVDDALETLATKEFDTIVSDIRMPGRDGFSLLAAVSADSRFRQIPVIILTGDGDRTLKRRALDMGAADLLAKPVDPADLVARLRSAIRLKEYEDRLVNQVDVLDSAVRERTRQLELSNREVVWRLAKAGEFRDDQTGNHVARVAWCSCALAKSMGLNADAVELLLQTSPLHDIGKIGIPDAILLKPGKLTPEERVVIERHAIIGDDILRDPPKAISVARHLGTSLPVSIDGGATSLVLEMARTIARHHHEKWDGSGYPDGLASAAIPLEARIVAVADVFDALVSERPYKKALSSLEARRIIASEAGRHFDPAIVEVFESRFEKIEDIHARIKT